MMPAMTELTVLRVFVGPDGAGGNPLGVFLDGPAVPSDRRQDVAADLDFSETVFVDDDAGSVEVYTPTRPIPFAGHPLVGTAWLLAAQGAGVDVLRPPAGEVATWEEDGLRWIRAQPAWSPVMDLVRYGDPATVEQLGGPPAGSEFTYCWAWIDESDGAVRARAFAPSYGVPEDEATGSAAVRLVATLGRPLTIRQGAGSELRARPGPNGMAEVGGKVAIVERRDYPA